MVWLYMYLVYGITMEFNYGCNLWTFIYKYDKLQWNVNKLLYVMMRLMLDSSMFMVAGIMWTKDELVMGDDK